MSSRRADAVVDEPGLLDYVRILWRHKVLILLTVVIAVAAMVGIDHTRTKVYQGTAQVLFTMQGQPAATAATVPVTTDLQLVDSAPVQALVAKQLGLPKAPKVAVTEVGTTNVANVAVSSTDPAFAAKAANAYARAYITVGTNQYLSQELATERQIQDRLGSVQTQVTSLNAKLSGLPLTGTASTSLQARLSNLYSQESYLQQQLGQIQIVTAEYSSAGQLVTSATVPTAPVSPKKAEDAILAGLVGLLLGIGLALLRDHFDDRLRSAEDLENASGGLPTIGLIPAVRDWRDHFDPLLVSALRPHSPAAEAYRTLRTSVQFMSLERPVKLLQITSAAAAEGKTTTAANVAYTMADAGQRVALVDCDLRRPRVHEFYGLANTVGLTSVMAGTTTLDEALHQAPNEANLFILGSGPIPPNPAELLAGERVGQIFNELLARFDIVILDSSPVLPVTDPLALAARADAVLIVASAGVTTTRSIERTIELLGRVDARVIGTVFNRAPQSREYYGAGYGYGYGYFSEHANGNGKDPAVAAAANGNGKVAPSSLGARLATTMRRSRRDEQG
jgi:capsular exopolysaccharide synthesis family protein